MKTSTEAAPAGGKSSATPASGKEEGEITPSVDLKSSLDGPEAVGVQ
jgi:hypothetical protein